MESVVPPFSQWIQNIRCDITNILQRFKNVGIHRSKVAGLFNQLNAFSNQLKNKKFPNTPPNPSESGKLRVALKLISLIRELIKTFDKANAINSIKKDGPEAIVEMLKNFRIQLGEAVVSLKIVPQSPFPIDKNQIEIDDANDAKQIIKIITQYLDENKGIDSKEQDILTKRLSEYKEILNNSPDANDDEEEEDQKDRIVPPDELQQRIKPVQKYALNHADFQSQKKIGSGAFADVFMGIQKSTNKVVAIKQLQVKEFTEESLAMYLREVEIMGDLKHFAVLPFIGVTVKPPYWIITEFMSGGGLFQRIHGKTNKLDGTKKTIIALGIAYAMEYVHSKNYIHRDLKSLNILLDEDDYPYVCDFGISRIIANTTMTGTLGTPQWMAPEVISSQRYDSKADVYSYGVILWELLMNEVPFRGLQPVQVMMSVVSRKNRPMIPPDMQGNLAKFIKACWDHDPKVRPAFDAIVAAFESGKINYPGTNQDTVNAYRARFIKTLQNNKKLPQKMPIQKTPGASGKEISIDSLISQLISPSTAEAAAQTIAKYLMDKNQQAFAKKLLENPQTMPDLIKACDLCESPEMASHIIRIFTALSHFPNVIKPILIQKVIGIYVHFGTTQMTEILEFFNLNMKLLSDIKLNGTILDKFASFLKSSDVSLRVQATNLLVLMIEKKVYAKPESLKEILSIVIQNIESSATPALVLPSLKIIKMMIPYQELFEVFTENHIFASTVSIFTSKFVDEKIYVEASSIFKLIIDTVKGKSKVILTQEDVELILRSLQTVPKTLPKNVLPLYIGALSSLLQLKVFYSTIGKDPKNEHSRSFESFLLNCQSDEATVLCLKICFALLCDQETQSKMAIIAKTSYIKLMTSSSDNVANLAAACLIQSTLDIKMILNDQVSAFLKKALSTSGKGQMELNALRLCGAFSSTFEGAQFLENEKISTLIAQFISNVKKYDAKDNKNLKNKLAVMAISSYSKVYPTSKVTIGLINDIIELLHQRDILMYTTTFLSNAVIHPSGAELVSKNFDTVAKCLSMINDSTKADGKSEDDTQNVYVIFQLVKIMDRVVTSPEAVQNIKNVNTITQIYEDAKYHFNDVLFNPYLELVSNLSCTQCGKEALKKSNIVESLNNKMNTMKKDDFRKFMILRIIARNSNN